MEKIKTNLQLKVIVPVLGVLIALSVVVVCSERHIEFGKLHDQHLADVRRVEWLMTDKINDDAVVYSALSEQICQNTAFQQAFVQRDRQALLELAEPVYAKLNSKYNVRHLYFHQLDKTCFLRVHSDLLGTESLTARQIDYVKTIYTSGQHLLSLINNVLDMSKIEAGKEQVVMAACSLRPLFGQVEDLMRISAESKGLCFEVDLSDAIPEQVVTDAKHLYQTLINLLGNAIKFTEQGSILLRAGLRDADADPTLYVEVADTGIGIPADRLGKVFQSFEQADVDTSIKYGGTGLGLAISQKLVEMMGGALTVTSEEGTGTTFTVTLPTEPVPQPV